MASGVSNEQLLEQLKLTTGLLHQLAEQKAAQSIMNQNQFVTRELNIDSSISTDADLYSVPFTTLDLDVWCAHVGINPAITPISPQAGIDILTTMGYAPFAIMQGVAALGTMVGQTTTNATGQQQFSQYVSFYPVSMCGTFRIHLFASGGGFVGTVRKMCLTGSRRQF